MNHETTSAKRRPTLLAGERDTADEAREPDCGPVSILSSIDAPTRSPRKRRAPATKPRKTRRWGVAAIAVAAVAVTVAGFVYIDDQSAALWAEAPAEPEPMRVTATTLPSQPVAAARPEVKETEPQAAVIETVAVAPAAAKEDPFSSLAPEAPRAGLEAAVSAADPSTRAAVAKASSAPVKPSRASRPAKRTATPTKRGDTKHAKASPQKDPDVDLIEALVSHMGGKQAAAGRRGEASLQVAAAGAAGASTRDVVLQQEEPALPTGELVRRCMTLGWLESQLCRARICSGHWGEDPACPLAQQQNADFRR